MRTPAQNPTELLFGSYRRQILGLLLARREESFHIRELARLTGVPVGSLHRELKALSEAGILTRTPAGNQVRYHVDRACPIFEPLAGIFSPAGEPAGSASDAQPSPVPTKGESGAAGPLAVGSAELASLCEAHGVRKLWLFGPGAHGEPGADDTLGVMVAFGPGGAPGLFEIADLREALVRLFGGRRVQLVMEGAIRNPIRRKSIERERVEAYAP